MSATSSRRSSWIRTLRPKRHVKRQRKVGSPRTAQSPWEGKGCEFDSRRFDQRNRDPVWACHNSWTAIATSLAPQGSSERGIRVRVSEGSVRLGEPMLPKVTPFERPGTHGACRLRVRNATLSNCSCRGDRGRASRPDASRQEIRRALRGSRFVGSGAHRRHHVQSMSTIAPRLPMTFSARECPAFIASRAECPVAVAAR